MKDKLYGVLAPVKKYGLFVAIGILALLPMVVSKTYILGLLCRVLMYATLAGSLNVINGYSGRMCIGHAGFFCIGSYVEAILATRMGISFWVLLPLAGAAAALMGLFVALPTLKMRGVYLAIITLGFSEIIRLLALNWTDVTGGAMGIKNIPVPRLGGIEFSNARTYYYIFLAIAVLFLFITRRVIRSRLGRAWMSIREDQLAARSLGVNTPAYKAVNFMYGAFWAGIIGAAYAPYARFIDSTIYTLDEGFNILSMVIVGGMGTLTGPLAGSVVINVLTELLRPIGQWRMVAYGVLIIVMMWFRPQGLIGASDSVLAGRDIKMKKSGEGAK